MNDSTDSKKRKSTPSKEHESSVKKRTKVPRMDDGSSASGSKEKSKDARKPTRDDAFLEFQRLCGAVAGVDAYTDKTEIVRKMLTKGCDGGELQDPNASRPRTEFVAIDA